MKLVDLQPSNMRLFSTGEW